MKIVENKPLGLEQAISVCNEYQHLKGNVVISENNDFEVIDSVAIAPHDKLQKLLFFKLYKEMKDAEKAISFYKDNDYSVVLILRELASIGDVYYKLLDLNEYVQNVSVNSRLNIYQQQA